MSDHGMTALESKTKVIVEDYLPKRDVRKVVGREAYMNILPHPGVEKSVRIHGFIVILIYTTRRL
jgi:hypothetical protein